MVQTMLLTSWGDAFVNMFTNSANIIAIVCLFVGLVLCCIECFVPGFGVFGILGIVFCVASLVITLVVGGEFAWIQLLYMASLSFVILLVVVLIAIRSAKFGALSRSPLVQKEIAIPTDYASNEKNFAFLLGKEGVTKTILKPVGKVEIEGKIYQVTTDGEYVEKDKSVFVAEVDGSTILVKIKVGEKYE